jgi:DNA-binding transcriptional ArsR family regulator
MSDELREQIEALRAEVRQLNDSFATLREEDVRDVFVQQVRPVLVERIDRTLGWPGSSGNREVRDALVEWVDSTLDAFERGGRAEGLRYLKRRSARSVTGGRDDAGLAELSEGIGSQLRSYIDLYGRVLRMPGERPLTVSSGITLSPEKAEATLGPLSNRIRISILQRLSVEADGLASLSRALGLQKGHIQFHLRSLLDGGYIDYDRKSRLYSLSLRGGRALDWLARMMDDLER